MKKLSANVLGLSSLQWFVIALVVIIVVLFAGGSYYDLTYYLCINDDWGCAS